MKNLFLSIFLIFFGFLIHAQSFNYQTIVRNSTGSPMVNVNVYLRVSVLETATSGVLYREIHKPTTDLYGWLSLSVGTGIPVTGTFSTLDFSVKKYLLVECSTDGGNTFGEIGVSELSGSIVGPKGDKGAKGDKGDKGDAGVPGAPGVAGPKGDTGDTGSNGSPGATGPKGDKGDKGDAGSGVKIIGSLATSANLPNPYSGAIGDMYITQNDGNGHVWTGTVWTNVGQIKGPKGDNGDQGVQGIAGPKGDTGLTGAKGDKGDNGATGIAGPKGDKGDTGLEGDKGDKGDTGLTGPKGDTGLTGATGPKGDKGDKGDPGSSAADAWLLNGNSGSLAPSFLGTTDDKDLVFKRNNESRFVIANNSSNFFDKVWIKQGIETPGTIKIGSDDPLAQAGKIRYNATSNDFEGYNGTIWKSFTSIGTGFSLPYSADYGGTTNPAFRINVQNNNTGIEVNNIALAGATRPAIRATSGGLSVVEIESTNLSSSGIGLSVQNNQATAAGINTSIGVVSENAVALSISGINDALVVNGSSKSSKAAVSFLNLGQGDGVKVEQINSTSTENAMHITSSSKGSALKVEVNKVTGQQTPNPASALEIGNGFIKVDQTAPFRSVFKHVTSAATVNGNASTVFYPGASASDIVFVQKSLPYIGTGVLVWWDPNILVWKIATENISNMPVGVTFNVMVIKTE